MRCARIVSLTAVCLLLAGCSATTPGAVSGTVHVYGGPSDPVTGQPANTGQPTGGQEVVVVDGSGNRTTTTSDPSGRYRLSLAPGDYTLMCGPMPTFTVRPGATTSLDCDLVVA